MRACVCCKGRTFTVHGDSTLGVLGQLDEALQDGVVRRAAVDEEEVVVIEAGVLEAPTVVDLLVQAHDRRHRVFAEVGEVRFRRMQWVTYRNVLSICSQIFNRARDMTYTVCTC